LLGVAIGGTLFFATAVKEESVPVPARDEVSIVTVFDNYAVNSELTTRWGFAAVVVTPTSAILFDTGSDRRILLSNMAKLKIKPADIHKIVISHVHTDHLGGLKEFLKVNNNVEVYIPASFPDSVRQSITASGARYRNVTGPLQIDKGVFTTGEMGTSPIEQSLVVNTSQGLVVVTGCAHPGIARIVKRAKEVVPNRPVALVMGGFHLGAVSDQQLRGLIQDFRRLGVRRVAPSHCSGDRARALFQAEYQDDYLPGGAGAIFRLE
jgi:7,8-dihydropterin-6-yl-methyl-4-(beta-D-ribofuranosyl)aminobenzene 5'-phosphate synthase